MFTVFLNFWLTIPSFWRYIIMIVPIALGTILFLIFSSWKPFMIGAAISLVLFLFPGSSDSERKGYHF